MKNITFIILIFVLLVGGIIYFATHRSTSDINTVTTTTPGSLTYTMKNVGMAFSYPGGEDGYVLKPQDPINISEPNFVDGITLTTKVDAA